MKSRRTTTKTAVGIAWYHAADYAGLLETFEDKDSLPDTYEEWLKRANRVYRYLKREGLIVDKVYLRPDEFPAWCAAKAMGLNSSARNQYAAEFVQRKYNPNALESVPTAASPAVRFCYRPRRSARQHQVVISGEGCRPEPGSSPDTSRPAPASVPRTALGRCCY